MDPNPNPNPETAPTETPKSETVNPKKRKPTAKKPPRIIPRQAESADILGPESIVIDENSIDLQTADLDPRDQTENEKSAAQKRVMAKMGKKEANQTAVILLGLLDGIAVLIAGPEAALNSLERDLILAPMERILQKMDITLVEKMGAWSDPILLIMGLTAWASRVYRITQDAKPKPEPTPEPTPEFNQPPQNRVNPAPDSEILITEALSAPPMVRDLIQSEGFEYGNN